jgi:hypothetical protein
VPTPVGVYEISCASSRHMLSVLRPPNLVYKRPGQHSDIYLCAGESGGCERTILHRRQKGKSVCGITPILNFGELGKARSVSLSPASRSLRK